MARGFVQVELRQWAAGQVRGDHLGQRLGSVLTGGGPEMGVTWPWAVRNRGTGSSRASRCCPESSKEKNKNHQILLSRVGDKGVTISPGTSMCKCACTYRQYTWAHMHSHSRGMCANMHTHNRGMCASMHTHSRGVCARMHTHSRCMCANMHTHNQGMCASMHAYRRCQPAQLRSVCSPGPKQVRRGEWGQGYVQPTPVTPGSQLLAGHRSMPGTV